MDVCIVYLVSEHEFKKGEVRTVPTSLAQQLVEASKACYYADFTTKMLEDLEDPTEPLEGSSKKKGSKKD